VPAIFYAFSDARGDLAKTLQHDGIGMSLYVLLGFIRHLLQLNTWILIPLSGGLRPHDQGAGPIDCIA